MVMKRFEVSVLLVECPSCGELCSVVGQIDAEGTPYMHLEHPDRPECVEVRGGGLNPHPIAVMGRKRGE